MKGNTPLAPPRAERLLELVDAFHGQPVAMVVDLVVDRFIHGTARRISREAPVLILRHDGEVNVPGGGANAVANVAALGGRPVPLGVVGDDEPGRCLLELLGATGVEVGGIAVRPGYRTPTKTRIVAGGRHAAKQQLVRYDIEDTLVPTTDDDERLLDAVTRHAADARAVVLSDYGYGVVHPGLVDALRARLPTVPLLGDSRYRLHDFSGLDGATPNLEEAEKALGGGVGRLEDEALEPGGEALRRRLGLPFLLVTRGSAGMSLFTAGAAWHLPVHGTDQVADVTGAGDTVIGTFALASAAGANPLEAACLANYAGGLVVMKQGTATLAPGELRDAVRRGAGLLDRIEGGPVDGGPPRNGAATADDSGDRDLGDRESGDRDLGDRDLGDRDDG
ncbi:MAG: PfkB family carbohydrate kinase [Acidobacteriota bacterium]